MLITTPISEAKKTKGIAVTYRAGAGSMYSTCPPTCKLLPAEARGKGDKRGEQGGPGEGDRTATQLDQAYFRAVLGAVPVRGVSFTFTHWHPKHWAGAWERRTISGRPTTVVNWSADSLAQARVMWDSWRVPMVLAVSLHQARVWATLRGDKAGREGKAGEEGTDWRVGYYGTLRIVRCPAEYMPNVGCAQCGGAALGGLPLCARPHRDYLIGFTAHGAARAAVGDSSRSGGCYAAGGNVRLHWRRLAALAGNESTDPWAKVGGDIAQLRAFVSTLPPGTVLRHHVAGDLGESTREGESEVSESTINTVGETT